MEISGQFKAHDAFVNMCFGHIADIEEFEKCLAEDFHSIEEEEEEARSLLRLITAQTAKSGVLEAWTDYMFKSGGSSYAPLSCEPSKEVLELKVSKLEQLMEKKHSFEVDAAKEYIKNKGKGFINTFNGLRERLRYVKEQTDIMEENKYCATKMASMFASPEEIEDLHKFTEVVKEENGLTKTITKTVNGEDVDEEVPVKIDVRRIKDTTEDRRKAAKWVHEYVKTKNMTLSADELSGATITRYIENVAQREHLNMSSIAYLKKCALLSVPIPSMEDINMKMVTQSPAARERRQKLAVLNSEGF